MWTYIGVGVLALLVWAGITGHRDKKAMEQQFAAIPDFHPAFRHSKDLGFIFGLDPERRKLALLEYKQLPRVVSLDEIIAVELMRDGNRIERTNRGSQVMGLAVGALALGGVGALISGLSGSKRSHERVKKLSLKLYTTQLADPVIELMLMESRGGKVPGKAELKLVDDWYGRFRAVLHEPAAPASFAATPALTA